MVLGCVFLSTCFLTPISHPCSLEFLITSSNCFLSFPRPASFLSDYVDYSLETILYNLAVNQQAAQDPGFSIISWATASSG